LGNTGGRISFGTFGVGRARTGTSPSTGTKIVYYSSISNTEVDYAVGVDSSNLWHTVPSGARYEWFLGTAGVGLTANSRMTLSLTGSGNTGSLYINGALGVGTNNVSVNGMIRATNDVVAFFSSDERLKKNKTRIGEPLLKVSRISGYEFDWVPATGIHDNVGRDVGVIAQEVAKVLPEIVTTRDNGYMAVKYEKLTALLIEAVKELTAEVKELKSRVEDLERGKDS
jgi:hypothetical protein